MAILDLCRLRELPKVAILATQLNLFQDPIRLRITNYVIRKERIRFWKCQIDCYKNSSKFNFGRPSLFWHDLDLQKKQNLTSEMDSAYMKTLEKSKVSGLKVNFPSGLRRPSWMYADYEICPMLPSWQKSWICSRTPLDNESPYEVYRKELLGSENVKWNKQTFLETEYEVRYSIIIGMCNALYSLT